MTQVFEGSTTHVRVAPAPRSAARLRLSRAQRRVGMRTPVVLLPGWPLANADHRYTTSLVLERLGDTPCAFYPELPYAANPVNWLRGVVRTRRAPYLTHVLGEPVAWRAIRAVKSNAILLADQGASVGVGMGQVKRVDSCRLAVSRAGEQRARGAVAASDAFFPFADGLQVLLDAGVRAVVAPGGSKRDAEVVDAATAAGVTMYFTGTRHFAH